MARALRVCSRAGCPNLTSSGRCDTCRLDAERIRGSAAQRGYNTAGHQRFRAAVLGRDPICVLCQRQPSKHADHHPLDRKALVAAGLNPNDPQRGRGLCQRCHARETAAHQPGGWNAA